MAAASFVGSAVTSSMMVWMNRILSSTGTGSTNGYRSSRPIDRLTMFRPHDSGSHISMIVLKPLGPNTFRS